MNIRSGMMGMLAALCITTILACTRQNEAANVASQTSVEALPNWAGTWSSAGGNPGRQEAPPPPRDAKPPLGPLTPKYLALADIAFAKYGRGGGRMAKCLPAGMPGILTHGITFEFALTPRLAMMVFENGEVRRIHTDGRTHPDAEERYGNVEGHSIGQWQGDTLIVDTLGMSNEAELFVSLGLTVTPSTHVVERMFLRDDHIFQIDTTVVDPEVFTEPYTYSKTFADSELGDYEIGCLRRDTEDSVDLTPPPFAEIKP